MAKKKRVNTSKSYQAGGTKNEWLSEKISSLVLQGKSLDEATAISNAIYNSGNLPKKQIGEQWDVNNPYNLPNIQGQTQSPQQDFSKTNQAAYMGAVGNAMYSGGVPMSDGNSPNLNNGQGLAQQPNSQFNNPFTGTNTYFEDINKPTQTPFQSNVDPFAKDSLQTAQNFATNNPYTATQGFQGLNYNPGGVENIEEKPTDVLNPQYDVKGTRNQKADENGRVQFIQPYGGFDIPSAAFRLGQGLESGNAFDIGVSGLKLATGLGRNVASGFGNANRRKYIMKDYQERAREGSLPVNQYMGQDGGYYQDGGQQMPPEEQGAGIEQQVAEAIQGGADPQAIVEQLVQSGASEQEAVQLVQGIIQQLQAPQEAPPQMKNGGIAPKKKEEEDIKVATNEFEAEQARGEKVAELEGGEQIQRPDGEIKQVIGDSHSKGGVELTAEQLPDGSKILSDHLKVGKEGAKRFNDDYDLGIKSTDTYAAVMTKYNKKTGLTKLVEEQETITKGLQKQAKNLIEHPTREDTIRLNIELLEGEFQEIEEKKAPITEARKTLFEEIFQPQEESKSGHNKEEAEKPIMQDGGTYNGDMIMEYSRQYGISPERIKELMNVHRDGGLQQHQNGAVQNPLLQNSTTLSNFTNSPSGVGSLPYTPREENTNEIWQGTNYADVWKPLVEKSMADPEQAKKIDSWLMANKGTFSPNVQKQLETLTGAERYARIQQLATDEKPGLFHNAVLEAIKSTTPITQAEPATDKKPFDRGESDAATQYRLLNLPDQSPLLPDSLQGALKKSTRYDRVEAPLVSPDQQINEIRRQETAAMSSLNSLPDAQRASAIAQIQANTQANLNNVISQTQGANQQARFSASNANAQIQAREENERNRNLTDYESKILKADAITQANIRNYFNTAQRVNVGNFNAVRNANLINSMYDNKQFDGDGNIISTNLDYLAPYIGSDYMTPEQTAARQALYKKEQKAKLKPKKRFGGKK